MWKLNLMTRWTFINKKSQPAFYRYELHSKSSFVVNKTFLSNTWIQMVYQLIFKMKLTIALIVLVFSACLFSTDAKPYRKPIPGNKSFKQSHKVTNWNNHYLYIFNLIYDLNQNFQIVQYSVPIIMIRCVDRMVTHMQTNAFWNLLRADNMQNRTFMFLLKENVGIQEVRCIFFDCFFILL